MEWVGIGGIGMQSYLEQTLAQGLGIASGIHFPFPRDILDCICRDNPEAPDPFKEEISAWSIFERLPHLLEQPGFEPLRRYLPDRASDAKRLGLAKKIAHLFSEYALYRPEMVMKWEKGEGTDWQACLWRALVERIGSEHIARCAASFLKKPEDKIRNLPFRRLCFFGIPTFSPLYISVLSCLARFMDVHLFVLSPSMEWWADAKGEAASMSSINHPLLSAFGRTGSEFQWLLEENAAYLEPVGDLHEDPVAGSGAGVLQTLQSDMLNLRSPRRSKDRYRTDRTLQVHACSGAMRELEVAKDRILALFDEADGNLSPDDIAVVAPNIRAFAPYIEAVFASDEQFASHHIAAPYSGEDPVLFGFLKLLQTVSGRLTVREVFDLAAVRPVSRRFKLSAQDVIALEEQALEAGVRWGRDLDHRAAFDQPRYEENTWRFGLDRQLLGLALSPEDGVLFGERAPCGEPGTDERARLLHFLMFTETMFSLIENMSEDKPPAKWKEILLDALSRLFSRDEEYEPSHRRIRKILNAWIKDCEAAGFDGPLSFAAVHRFILDKTAQRQKAKSRKSRGITFADIGDVRGVPFRVICVLGLNEGDFPRQRRAPGFDLTAANPRAGDRSVLDDDRYQFLELLLSARDALILTYTGVNSQTGAALFPSTAVSDLLHCLKQSFDLNETDVVLKHPISPYHPDYFGQSDDPRMFSYNRTALLGARAVRDEAENSIVFFDAPLPRENAEDITVDVEDLVLFFTAPQRRLLKERLGVSFPWTAMLPEEREPMMSSRDDNRVVRLLLKRGLSGARVFSLEPEAGALGLLPLGQAGSVRFQRLSEKVAAFLQKVDDLKLGPPLPPVIVDIPLQGSWGKARLVGQIDGLMERGLTAFSLSKHRDTAELLSLRIRQSALAAESRLHGTTALISFEAGARFATEPAPPADPADELTRLLTVYLEGMNRPVPLFPEISFKFVKDRAAGKSRDAALQVAKRTWLDLEPARHAAALTAFRGLDPFDMPGDSPLSFEEASTRVFLPILEAVNRGRP